MIKLAVTLWMVTTTHAVTNPLAHRLHRAETSGHRRRLASSHSVRRRLPLGFKKDDPVSFIRGNKSSWVDGQRWEWNNGKITQIPVGVGGRREPTYQIDANGSIRYVEQKDMIR